MIKSRLEEFLNANNILPLRTYAYRKGRSASTCINDLLHTITSAKERGEKVIVLSLDISKAYDCVDINRLSKILMNDNFPIHMTNWIIKFLERRYLVLGDERIEISNGIPQGSCLSPTLFNIYTKELHNITNNNTHLFQFADDFIMVSNNKEFSAACDNLQNKANQFYSMLKQLNLTYNSEKTMVMYVAKGARLEPKIKIQNTPVANVKSLKFLGRHIKNSLSLKEHYQEVLIKCKPAINAVKMASSAKSSMTPQTAIKLTKTLVFSKAQYAISSMAHAPNYINAKLISFQNQLLRTCLGLTRTTPVQAIYALSAIMPPKQRAQYLAAKELLRVKVTSCTLYNQITKHPSRKSSWGFIYTKFKDIFDSLNPLSRNNSSSKINIKVDLLQAGKNDTPKEVLNAIYTECIDQLKGEGFCIWATDASVGSNTTGCAACNISCNHNFLFTIGGKVSSLTGELHAIDKAIDIIIEEGMEKAAILTDSRNACLLLKKNTSQNDLVNTILNKVDKSLISEICLIWTPSHVGIKPNETADYFAKAATNAGMDITTIPSLKDCSRSIYNILWEEWIDDYRKMSRKTGNFFASIFPTPPRKPWFHNVHLPPHKIKLLNRLLTGHTKSKVFLKRMSIESSDICDSCNVIEDTGHLIFTCTKYNDIRLQFKLFQKFNNMHQILSKFEINDLMELLKFIDVANIKL